jgi:hypothetical protein
MNWAGMVYTKKKGLGTTPGDTYNGGMCECGHSALAHSTQGHMSKGYWQCWNGKWCKQIKPFKFMMTALSCGYHKFKAVTK